MPVNQSYFIAIPVPEPLNSEINEMKKDISARYHTRSVLKSPPHITIIPPFAYGYEERLLECLNEFSYPSFAVDLDGFDCFSGRVVYIKPKENKLLQDLQSRFSHHFYQRFPQLKQRSKYSYHPHITIGNRDWSEDNFHACWNEYKTRSFQASFQYEKLILLKLVNGLWKVLSTD